MALTILVSLSLLAAASATQSSHVRISQPGHSEDYGTIVHHKPVHPPPKPYHPHPPPHHKPVYAPHPPPYGHPAPYAHPTPYAPKPPAYGHPKPAYNAHPPHYKPPICASNTTKPYCLHDYEYPTYEIKAALEEHYNKIVDLYADVSDLNTELSVYGLNYLKEETYLCPSETDYIQPLRAINIDGKWRIIVNNVEAHYQILTQTARVEECLATYGEKSCPLVPECYESKCVQKSVYHRFLVYDPYDQYFPFAIESFKLPASCACLLGGFEFKPVHKYV